MRMRLHPEETWTAPYQWHDVDVSHLQVIDGVCAVESRPDENQVVLRFERCRVEITAVCDGVLNLRVFRSSSRQRGDQAGAWPAPPPIGVTEYAGKPPETTVSIEPETVRMSTPQMAVEIDTAPFSFRVLDVNEQVLLSMRQLRISETPGGFTSVASFDLDEADHFFGFGGRTAPIDRKGRTFDQFATKVATEVGDYGGFPMPFFLNPRGYGFILNNPYPHVYFDLGYTDSRRWLSYTPDGPIDMYVLAGPGFPEILSRYYQLTGRPPVPPKWLLGLWVSVYRKKPERAEDWIQWVERFRAEEWPIDVIILDLYWRGGVGATGSLEGGAGKNLEWDREGFGDGPSMIDELTRQNVHVGLHLNTRMYSGDLAKEGLTRGYLREAREEQVVPVVTDHDSERWNWRLHQPRVEEGAELWWTDNGERVDGSLGNGWPSRNLFGQVWNDFLYRGMESMGKDGHLVLSRGGWIGAHRSTLPWPGDTLAGTERLKLDLRYILNLAMSGVPFTTVDLGGFTEREAVASSVMHADDNVIRRVVNGFLLFPVPRLHNSGAQAKFPWFYPQAVQDLFRRYIELRYQLLPYIYSASVEAGRTAIPIARPLVFDYPSDTRTYSIEDQLLFGPSLMMAPVVEAWAGEREVYLPPGRWIDYWSGEAYSGSRTIVVDAPLYSERSLPVFVRVDAMIPYRQRSFHNPEDPDETILLDLYVERRSEYTLWEDGERSSRLSATAERDHLHLELENATDRERTYLVGSSAAHRTDERPPVTVAPGETTRVELAHG